MGKYKSKPIIIDAVQFLGFNPENGQVMFNEKPDWLVAEFGKRIIFFDKKDILTIKSSDSINYMLGIGHYIIKRNDGELSICTPGVFQEMYDKAD